MAKTVVGLFDDRTSAHKAVRDLEKRGFGKEHLRYASHEEGEESAYEVDPGKHADPDRLENDGVPREDAEFYAEAVRRGGSLVVALVHDDDEQKAAEIIARHNPIPPESRSSAYREEGYEGYSESKPYNAEQQREERSRYAEDKKRRMQEIEEQLKVGKREVVSGRVRVHKYVDTDVVEEKLRLREEEVHVDRDTADRKLSPEEADAAFEEETIEMTERDEEAVVDKEARVTGEVAVGKDVREREETVGGEVRSTRVEVEEGTDSAAASGVKWVDALPKYRKHHKSTFSGKGDFSDYEPAYRYGHEMSQESRFRDRDYADAESDLRKGYINRRDEQSWKRDKDAIRHAFTSTGRSAA